MEKKLKMSSKLQLDRLISLMEENPDIGRGKPNFGSSRALAAEKWQEIAKELNGYGPPIRTGKEWKRVWINYKGNLKRKLSNNRKNFQATGGGPSTEVSLSANEQSVVDLIYLYHPANPSGKTHGLTTSNTETEKDGERNNNLQTEKENEIPQCSGKRLKTIKKTIEEERLDQLKTQANTQTAILATLKSIDSTIYKNYKVNKQMYELKQQKAEIDMEYKKYKIELAKKKIQRRVERVLRVQQETDED